MNSKDFNNIIIDSMKFKNKQKVHLEEKDDLLRYLNSLFLVTGSSEIMFCNTFLSEAIQLLKNSIFLYEDGYFDCGFYSIRQACEVVTTMLYLSNNGDEELENWSAKKYFPMNSKIKDELKRISKAYVDVQVTIADYFEHHAELIRKSHKIIHKQGFDTFYNLRCYMRDKVSFCRESESRLFLETLKYSIGYLLIIFILIDPIALTLVDDSITMKLNFNFYTSPVDTSYFEKFLDRKDVVSKLLEAEFYKSFISFFENKEIMSPPVYSVVRGEFWDVDSLDGIEAQLNLLNYYEQIMFYILRADIKISNFFLNYGLTWYMTSIKSNCSRNAFGKLHFERYLDSCEKINQRCNNIYVSVIMISDEPLFMEHNEPLNVTEIKYLQTLEENVMEQLKIFDDQIAQILDNSAS